MTRLTVRKVGSVKKRQHAKYAIDVQRENDHEALFAVIALFRWRCRDPRRRRVYLLLLALCGEIIEDIRRDIDHITQPIERKYLRINDPHLRENFTINFRFRREHLHRLLRCLRIPVYFELDNHSIVNGQEGLLIFLKLFTFPRRLVAEEVFCGWEQSRLCRIFNWVSKHIFTSHRHRIQNYLDWHVPYLARSKTAIQHRKRKMHPQGFLNPRTMNVSEHYDGFRIEVCRPQGALGHNANGQRIHLDIQAQIWSGHKKVCSYVIIVHACMYAHMSYVYHYYV